MATLEHRYDGPIPKTAAIHADHGEPWSVQLANRRDIAAREVRRIGRECLHEKRAALDLLSARHHDNWKALRRQLRFALDSYVTYREWARSAEVIEPRIEAQFPEKEGK